MKTASFIKFQNIRRYACAVLSFSVVSDPLRPPWSVARQAPLSMGILQVRILESTAIPSFRGIFPTQESNQGVLHYRRILYQLSYKGCQKVG